jgi:hypothetical protein
VEEAVRCDGERLQDDVYKMLRLLDAALDSKVPGRCFAGCFAVVTVGAA